MKRRRRISLSTVSALLVLLGSTLAGAGGSAQADERGPAAVAPTVVPGAPADHGPGAKPKSPLVGDPKNPRACLGIAFTDPAFFCGDPRLGPRFLPKKGVLGAILADYRRLGGQTANGFIATWWNPNTGGFIFPPNDGYRSGVTPFSVSLTFTVGQRIDRFGGEGGRFLAPAGTPYFQRSLTPQSLNTIESDYPFNYHVYKVLKPFTVQAGFIEPWFGQPGNGVQYVLPPGDSVGAHVVNGDLARLN
ncbi:TNT domain-containing protein [Streptomyces sp. NPDC088354]|uniref:TNT domain-containing protein n=1 Tax=unclassified Streptomyces TaxID=2593676 RepID=UPI0029BA99AD|nr:TNT domain-containing protein [Streptomyces sp. MI02-7b]MDX3075302.1 TNT domain-containing protein [Streptomyces sp. MI02-7b]